MNDHVKTDMQILLVEDDPGHALLVKKNLRRSGISYDIVTLDDGQKALDYLFNQGMYAGNGHPAPHVVLLDLNLPVLTGYRVLEIVKSDTRTKRIPVIVLTTTDTPHEIKRCYELGCNAYITKPIEYDRFSETMQRLGMFLIIMKTPGGTGDHG
jgi:CheY-like chemotaxis protein